MEVQTRGLIASRNWKFIFLCVLCVAVAFGGILWGLQADPFTIRYLPNKNIYTQQTPSFIVSPRDRCSTPVLIFANTASDILQGGPIAKEIARAGFSCCYFSMATNNVKASQEQFAVLVHELAGLGLSQQTLVLMGDEVSLNKLLGLCREYFQKKPDLLICVPDDEAWSIDRAIETVTAANCPTIVAKKPNSKDISVSNLVTTNRKVEVLSFKNGEDFRVWDELFYKELAEHAFQHLIKSQKIAESPPLPRVEKNDVWLYLWPSISVFAVYVGIFLWQTFGADRAVLRYRIAIAAATAGGIVLAFSTAIVIQEFVGYDLFFGQFSQKLSSKFSTFLNTWQIPRANSKQLITYVTLADYNRKLVNWKVDDAIYNQFVLSPKLIASQKPELAWRQELWQFFYPIIRKSQSPAGAAEMLVQKLRLEVEIRENSSGTNEILQVWHRCLASPLEFEIVYVSALRSVGIPAKLNRQLIAEIYDENEWRQAPLPGMLSVVQENEKLHDHH